MTEEEALAMLQGDDPASIARAEAELWAMWCRSGIAEVDALLLEGVQAMEHQELEEAQRCFAGMIARAPWFAEGWNKRATARYLAGNYEGRDRRLPGDPAAEAASFRRAVRPGPLPHGARPVSRGGGALQTHAGCPSAPRRRACKPRASRGGGGEGERSPATPPLTLTLSPCGGEGIDPTWDFLGALARSRRRGDRRPGPGSGRGSRCR